MAHFGLVISGPLRMCGGRIGLRFSCIVSLEQAGQDKKQQEGHVFFSIEEILKCENLCASVLEESSTETVAKIAPLHMHVCALCESGKQNEDDDDDKLQLLLYGATLTETGGLGGNM